MTEEPTYDIEIHPKKTPPTRVMVHVSRKVGDNNYGSHGLDLSVEAEVPHTMDAEEYIDNLHTGLTQKLKPLLRKQYLELQRKDK